MHPWHDSYIDDALIETAFPVVIEIPNAVSVHDPAFADYVDTSQIPRHGLRQLRRFFED